MQLSLLLCLLLLSLPVGGLGHRHSPATKKRVRELPAVPTAAPAPRDFPFDLFRALVATGPDQNVVFSPLSVSLTLALVSLGARSHTKAQILEGLGVLLQGEAEEQLHRGFQQLLQELGRPRDDLQLSLGSALFVRPSAHLRDSFLSAARTWYLADTLPTDFGDPRGAQRQINDFVAKQTKGKIVDVVQDLDGTEAVVMVNYIFFKGKSPASTLQLPLPWQRLLFKASLPTHGQRPDRGLGTPEAPASTQALQRELSKATAPKTPSPWPHGAGPRAPRARPGRWLDPTAVLRSGPCPGPESPASRACCSETCPVPSGAEVLSSRSPLTCSAHTSTSPSGTSRLARGRGRR